MAEITQVQLGTDLYDVQDANAMHKGVDYITAGQVSDTTLGTNATAEGNITIASGVAAHAEGFNTMAMGDYSHAENGNYMHVNLTGNANVVQYTYSMGSTELLRKNMVIYCPTTQRYAKITDIISGMSKVTVDQTLSPDEALSNKTCAIFTGAIGPYSHSEGYSTIASGSQSHAEGYNTSASANTAHVEGEYNLAQGKGSHVEGLYNTAKKRFQHIFGKYGTIESGATDVEGTYVEIVGNGTGTTSSARSNARTLDWSGNEVLAGKLTVGAGPTNSMDVATKGYVTGLFSLSGTTLTITTT